jgi:hypothetical protein
MQPLSKVKSGAHFRFGADNTMATRPKVATQVAECICEWASTETMLALFLSFLLEASGQTTIAMYMALENRAAQIRMLNAAAKSTLPSDQFDIYEVLMSRFVTPGMKTRDKFAHWSWGLTDDLPNDLLLMQPDERAALHFTALHQPVPDFDRSKIFVVTERSAEKIVGEIAKGQSYLALFMTFVHKTHPLPERDRSLETLLGKPDFAEALTHHRNRKNVQATPPQSPKSGPIEAE